MSLKSNRKWILPEKLNSDVIEYILDSRKIEDKEAYLSCDAKDIPDSSHLFDSNRAAQTILESVNNNEKILIHGDFDADGICATSLIWEFLYRDLAKFLNKKVDVLPYIPSRIDQGYGLTEDSLSDILELKADLLISVDCGVRDGELINKYMEKGLKFVITDHHQPPEDLLKNIKYPLVHQMYPEKEYPTREICGTAVVFLLIQEIKKIVRMDTEITEQTKGIDLVALATITDIIPLLNVNRIFVKLGLNKIRKGDRLGLKMLCLRAGIDSKDVNTYHLGYVIGPRINAAGRIGSPIDAVRLLVSEDEKNCIKISNSLENLNFDRQRMTEEMRRKAQEQIESQEISKAIFIIGENWHEGVIGLVAGKLLEQYHRPVLVATNNHGVVKGSARSIQGFNITKALEKFSVYLERYGGHELAAGFTAKEDSLEKLKEELIKYADEQITGEQLTGELKIDLLLDSEDIDRGLVEKLKILEPLGFGNPKPIICITNLVVVKKQIMGKDAKHMKLVVKGNGIDLLTLTFFGCDEDTETIDVNSVIDVVGYPDINVWNGNENIQFNVKEWRFPS